MRLPSRILMLTSVLAAVSSVASGYAHWVFFANRSVPFTPVPASFNLASLTGNTVPYFISDQTPGPLMPGDSVANIVSQIQAAAAVWNTIPSSAISLTFGGYEAIGQPQTAPQSAPGIDVIFSDEVTPGLLAQTSLTWQESDVNSVANGAAFVPIRRSTVMLRKNLTTPDPLASYDDLFFIMAVHEFGHALGLQHTLTSGVMATQYTSGASKASPLSADDIAGVSLLYPAQNYLQGAGSVSGTVSVAGLGGVNMANVVAVAQNGTAISTLSNPDGTFQIQGVPPGQYYVYASPLPPPQFGETYPDNIVPPQDSQGNPFPAQTAFSSEFFGGARNPAQASIVTVSAGAASPGVNFTLPAAPGPAISYISTFDYVGANEIAVPSPPLTAGSRQYIVFGGPTGITGRTGLTPGLTVAVIGAASVELNTLAVNSIGFGEVVVDAGQVQSPQPVALVVTLPNDMYVLPYAFSVTPAVAPSITGVTSATDAFGNTTVNLQGTNLNASTSIVFDGAPATLLSANSDGSLTVAAPPASAGYTAYIEALSNGGQTSWQDLGTAPRPALTYSAPQSPSIVVNYGLLLPGASSMLDIIGSNTSFGSAPVSIGLASSDITVGQIWVLNSGRILANVTVSPQAQPGPVDLTVSTGLQTMEIPGGLQVQAANPNQMSLIPPAYDQATGLGGTPVGAVAVLSSAGLPSSLAGWTATLDFSSSFAINPQINGNLVSFQIPPGVPTGAAIVQFTAPGGSPVVPAVVMQIDAPVPVITSAVNAAGPISASNPAVLGATITLSVNGLTQSATGTGLTNTEVTVGGLGGVLESPLTITPGAQTDSYQIQFTVSANAPTGASVPIEVELGTRVSAPFNLAIAAGSLSSRK